MIRGIAVYGLITAAGSGTRMESTLSKQLMKIGSYTVLERSIRKLLKSKYIDSLVVVVKANEKKIIEDEIISKIKTDKKISLVEGSDSREKSTFCGLEFLKEKEGFVLMHDGARPFVSHKLIDKMIEEMKSNEALICGVKAKDTIKEIEKSLVNSTPDRSKLYMVQTPQIFDLTSIIRAYELYFKGDFKVTDDSSVYELLDRKVRLIDGEYTNIKITTKEDLLLAEILANMEDRDENR